MDEPSALEPVIELPALEFITEPVPLEPITCVNNGMFNLMIKTEYLLNKGTSLKNMKVYGTEEDPLFILCDTYTCLVDNKGRNLSRCIKYFHEGLEIRYAVPIHTTKRVKGARIMACISPLNLITMQGLIRLIHKINNKFTSYYNKLISDTFNNISNKHPGIAKACMQLSFSDFNNEPDEEKKSVDDIPGIYLVQPETLLGTNRYKFGMSEKNVDKRIVQYHDKTEIICKYYCQNPREIEDALKKYFTGKIYAGNEYIKFDDKDLMIFEFKKIVSRFIDISDE